MSIPFKCLKVPSGIVEVDNSFAKTLFHTYIECNRNKNK